MLNVKWKIFCYLANLEYKSVKKLLLMALGLHKALALYIATSKGKELFLGSRCQMENCLLLS